MMTSTLRRQFAPIDSAAEDLDQGGNRRASGIRSAASRPTPNAMAARVPTTNISNGGLNISSFMTTSSSVVRKERAREANGRDPGSTVSMKHEGRDDARRQLDEDD